MPATRPVATGRRQQTPGYRTPRTLHRTRHGAIAALESAVVATQHGVEKFDAACMIPSHSKLQAEIKKTQRLQPLMRMTRRLRCKVSAIVWLESKGGSPRRARRQKREIGESKRARGGFPPLRRLFRRGRARGLTVGLRTPRWQSPLVSLPLLLVIFRAHLALSFKSLGKANK